MIDESNIYKAKKIIANEKSKTIKSKFVLDKNYFIFIIASFLTAFLFFQLFTTIPLYNSDKLKLTEIQIGLLLALNGLIIFLFEMPLINYLENKKINATKIILIGSILMTFGFLSLLIQKSITVLMMSILFITFGQILLFSFSNTFAYNRAKIGQEGQYMAFYAMSFSAAQIISPKVGYSIIKNYNYSYNWILMSLIGILGIYLYHILHKNIKFETQLKNLKKT